jgi:hypothetical protein
MRPVAYLFGLFLAARCLAAPPLYVPAETRVALVPLVNVSGERWVELKRRQVERGNLFLRAAFSDRGFQLIDADILAAETSELGIDMSDEEQQKRATLYRLGRAVGADLIVCALIVDTDQSERHILEIDTPYLTCSTDPDSQLPSVGDVAGRLLDPILPGQKQGKAKIKLWLLDVKREQPIISGKEAEGKSSGGYFAFLDKGSKHQVEAVATALQELLKEFFKDYPKPKRARR